MGRKAGFKKKRHSKARLKNPVIQGTFKASARGGGVVIPERDDLPLVRIDRTSSGTALHGDKVHAAITRRTPGRDPKGAITRIAQRANPTVVGQIEHKRFFSEVRPLNEKIHALIEIRDKPDPATCPDGAWVVAAIDYTSAMPYEPFTGSIAEVLGQADDPEIAVKLLIRASGANPAFPPDVEAEAEKLIKRRPIRASEDRRDFRQHRIFTIDPATAKDFDDAISLHKADETGWRIGVHIADVSRYVKPGSCLDEEARRRSTSIYPLNHVVHMLPESLANHLCSLRPDEDKRTLSVLFSISKSGKVSRVKLASSLIRSVQRFAYEEVQCLFNEADRQAGLAVEKPEKQLPRPVVSQSVADDLLALRAAARALNDARYQRGALKLDMPETKVLFDAKGKVSDLRLVTTMESQMLIEAFMIAANEAVARTLEKHHYPALFRVHQKPDDDRLKRIGPPLARLGIMLPSAGISRKELQAALDKAQHHRAYRIVQRWVLKSMMRAQYQPQNIGHYGLASDSYLHFTSPIRRYPDLLAHRLVKLLIQGKDADDKAVRAIRQDLKEAGRYATEQEEKAQKIEWDALALYALRFMKQYEGDAFEGYVSGISPMGLFVELADYPVEGLVKIDMVPGWWELDKQNAVWRARSSKRTFGPGDKVKVQIEKVDDLTGRMDLGLLQGKDARKDRAKPGRKPTDRKKARTSRKSRSERQSSKRKPSKRKPSKRKSKQRKRR